MLTRFHHTLCLSLFICFSSTTLGGVQVTSQHSTSALNYTGSPSNNDLINSGQPTLSSSTVSTTHPSFPRGGITDGNYSNTLSHNTYFAVGSHFPATATYNLDVSVNTSGYDITSIQSFMGWATVSQAQANQIYSVEISTVGSASYTTLATINYAPFNGSGGAYETQVSITEDATGILATGVDSIRFTFSAPAANGTVIREIDVIGYATGSTPPPITVTSPSARHLVQRNSDNKSNISITGTYTGSPDRIEARAIVTAGGGNSGTSTAWQTIDTSPSGNAFSGTLQNLTAGGWYTLEVRSVTSSTPSTSTSVEKIGVGDIYLTAGQSNSANFGAPAYTPTDDRVSVRNAATGSTWILATDPLPIANGSGGSVWSRLGDNLVATYNIPIGFLCVGVGGTATSQWIPGTSNYNSRLRPALQSFPENGFRAVLWHQGESDSLANVSAATHMSRLQSIINQSRIDAGWTVPWYIAEVSFHPSSNLSQEEPVAAGQRAVIVSDTNVHLGPSTDAFHLENASGGKLSDAVHFNAAGLSDHAAQWQAILYTDINLVLENSDFEKNTTPTVTTVTTLADNAVHVTNTTSNASPAVLDWRILSASDVNAADGSNGYYNPGSSFYTGAVDTTNNGIMNNMSGKHIAFLFGGSAGNHFLQTTRAELKPHREYTLTIAIGIRDVGSGVFGNAKIDILANGQPLGTGASFTQATLDTLAGGSASGKFTDVSFTFTTGDAVTVNQPLAVRITKVNGGANTYLDFDNVRIIETPTSYGAWQSTHWGGNIANADPSADPDNDGLENLAEFAFGFDPNSTAHNQSILSLENGAFRVTRRIGSTAGISYEMESSTTLETNSWNVVTGLTITPVSSDGTFETVDLTRAGGWNSALREFFRLRVSFTN